MTYKYCGHLRLFRLLVTSAVLAAAYSRIRDGSQNRGRWRPLCATLQPITAPSPLDGRYVGKLAALRPRWSGSCSRWLASTSPRSRPEPNLRAHDARGERMTDESGRQLFRHLGARRPRLFQVGSDPRATDPLRFAAINAEERPRGTRSFRSRYESRRAVNRRWREK